MNWNIQENEFTLDSSMSYEALMTQGNGYMHLRGSHEDLFGEYDPSRQYWRMPTNVTAEEFQKSPCKYGFYILGIYGKHPLLGQQLVNLPHFLRISLSVDNEQLSLDKSVISNYSRVLDMKTACLRRSFIWHTRAGAKISLVYSRFISASHNNLCMQKLSLVSDTDVDVTVTSSIDADVRTNGYDHFSQVEMAGLQPDIARCSVVTDFDKIDIASKVKSDAKEYDYRSYGRQNHISFQLNLKAQEESLVEKQTLIKSYRDSEVADLSDLRENKVCYDSLFQQHADIWKQWWDRSDIVIEGDSNSQFAVRMSLYHLIRCKVMDQVSIDAKGYSGDAYFGRFFWDTEVFMLPFYLYAFPQNAGNLLDFRVNTLRGAMDNARSYGYPGAKYAWESSMDGQEQCACWQYADHEIHIGADIVYAFDQYRRAVDSRYVSEKAVKVIVEIARYYLARIDRNRQEGRANLLGVMGPDEYTPICNNNAYTNWMVRFTLKQAAQFGSSVGVSDQERDEFIEAASKLHIPRQGDLILQCEDFHKLEELDFDRVWPERKGVIAKHISQERLYRSKCIKQADVIMLMMMFSKEFSKKEMMEAWNYYLPFTTHDSSLSVAVHAKVALQLGMLDKAMEFWKESMDIDFNLERKGAQEGVHIASYGMNWQLMVFGFGGVDKDTDDGILRLQPSMPPSWSRLAFPIIWQGNNVYIDIAKDGVVINNDGPHVVKAEIGGNVVEIIPNQEISLPYDNVEDEEFVSFS